MKKKLFVVGVRGFLNMQGGIETHCENLYINIQKITNNFEITILCSRKPKYNHYKGINFIYIPTFKNKFLEKPLYSFLSTLYILKNKPTIVHFHGLNSTMFLFILKIFKFKIIFTHHSLDYNYLKWGKIAKFILKLNEKIAINYADKIIAISNNIKNYLENFYAKKIYYIPNGVVIPRKIKSDDYIKSLGLEKNKYIIAVGRFVEEKGFHDLIQAYNKLNTNIKLVLVGDADHETNYSRKLKNLAKNSNNIILTGFIKGKKLGQIYSYAKLFVMPSYYEGLPIALLEAMSYNLDILVSNIPANLEVEGLKEEDYFEVGNINDLKNKLKQKLKINKRRSFEKIIKEKYNWNKIAKQTLDIYKKIID
jgi:starch synthase